MRIRPDRPNPFRAGSSFAHFPRARVFYEATSSQAKQPTGCPGAGEQISRAGTHSSGKAGSLVRYLVEESPVETDFSFDFRRAVKFTIFRVVSLHRSAAF